jgi:hypothetical protein
MRQVQVFITVDTELWPRVAGWNASDLHHTLRRDVFGATAEGEFGIEYQMDVLESYGLKGVFLVEALFASAVGIEPLAVIVAAIQTRGHEVQLHLHPEWLEWMPRPLFPRRSRCNMHQFTLGEQVELLSESLANLRKAGAQDVCAFRAGNYGASVATLAGLEAVGIEFDTSYNHCYLDTTCAMDELSPMSQPSKVGAVWEVPVSFFSDYPGHYRHAQLCACSFGEMKDALSHAYEAQWPTFVIVSHSFELLKNSRKGIPIGPDHVVIRRFQKLCRFLADHRDNFATCGFADIEVQDFLGKRWRVPPSSRLLSTSIRWSEQLLRRF